MKVSTQFGQATLTTNHSQSSYGLPVVVLDDGTVLGSAEAGPVNTPPLDETQVAEIALVQAARSAGYAVYC